MNILSIIIGSTLHTNSLYITNLGMQLPCKAASDRSYIISTWIILSGGYLPVRWL